MLSGTANELMPAPLAASLALFADVQLTVAALEAADDVLALAEAALALALASDEAADEALLLAACDPQAESAKARASADATATTFLMCIPSLLLLLHFQLCHAS
ncbi:MAG TPA: hypothetical protein DCP91_03410 [Eggerthellaceae bacterium]|nr:hypothetical protein [Eggerthellaceae bacterium]